MTAEPPGVDVADRCPTCGAAVKAGDPWCTLCYADLRPPVAAPPPRRDPLASPAGPPRDPLTAPIEALSGPTWPCATCGAVNRMERDVCADCGSPFLSGLRDADGPLLELPVVGDITRLGRGQRYALAGGVVLAFIVLTLLLGLLFG